MRVETGKVVKYFVLPGILPRLQEIYHAGFSSLAFFMAYIYRDLRLLPAHHPYLRYENKGRFGVRHVMGEAWRHLSFRKENIDQIIIFFTLLAGICLMTLQCGLFVGSMVIQAAHAAAAPASATGGGGLNALFHMFVNPPPAPVKGTDVPHPEAVRDIALNMLDRVFGIPGMFDIGSAKTLAAYDPSWPSPFHKGMHRLLDFYNTGILVIAFIIFLYFVTTVVAETAQSGTPFGQRFNKAWVPVRLILAVGLLVPLGTDDGHGGVNTAQYITLKVAKAGSALATNGLDVFVKTSNAKTPYGDPSELVARPPDPRVTTFYENLFLALTCSYTQYYLYDRKLYNERLGEVLPAASGVEPYFVGNNAALDKGRGRISLNNLRINSNSPEEFYNKVLAYYNNKDVVLKFGYITGDFSPDGKTFTEKGSPYEGNINPICGEMKLHTTTTNEKSNPGSYYINACYLYLVSSFFLDIRSNTLAKNLVQRMIPGAQRNSAAPMPPTGFTGTSYPSTSAYIDGEILQPFRERFSKEVPYGPDEGGVIDCSNILEEAQKKQIKSVTWDQDMAPYGWGGAAIFYNKIAEINGQLVEAVHNVPTMVSLPLTMEEVAKARKAASQPGSGDDQFNPSLGSRMVQLRDDLALHEAIMLHYAKSLWKDAYLQDYPEANSSNAILSAISFLFGLQGLFDLPQSQNINPLAEFSAIGKDLIESSIGNFVGATGALFISAVAQKTALGQISKTATSFMGKIGKLGLGIGFILFYVVPFMPFMYFFFAISRWVQTIVEAMAGLPLWAMAHIRIDGDGIPGRFAANGYFLILEILLRPVMIVFGLLAGIIVFTAQVYVFHEIFFTLVVPVVGGSETASGDIVTKAGDITFWRGGVDKLFYTVIYASVVYLMATSSFKMIDRIPESIIRFAGAQVQSYLDFTDDPASGLVQRMFTGIRMSTSSLSGLAASALLG